MKERTGGLGKFLNEITQVEEKEPEQIIYIDIDKIETNPRNFYGLRDIDELAGLIAVSQMIEPLTVRQEKDGKYMLISGHRRRAAVQKLLEEGTYTERRLPCIVKAQKKIKIEEENGEIIEFDEEAVEMLNLIASNRGQREERTIDEKLQEVKYLEGFARAIYNQKERGNRGNFRNFFAEEILNISKSQLQRINSIGRLTEKVKEAIDDKKISETAATELATMTPEEQDKCLEKIINGEIKGTVQDIQKYKQSENEADVKSSKGKSIDEKEKQSIFSQDISSKMEETSTLTNVVNKIIDIPEKFDDPQKEAQNWFYREQLGFYQMKYEEAKRMKESETNELKAAQWGIRASVALYNIEELKIHYSQESKLPHA